MSDELTLKIGELIGEMGTLNKSVAVLHKKADQTSIQNTEMRLSIDKVHSDFERFKKELEPTIDGTKDYLENKKIKYGLIGVLTFGLVSGATITDLLARLKGISSISSLFK